MCVYPCKAIHTDYIKEGFQLIFNKHSKILNSIGRLINKFDLLHRYLLSLQFEELFLLTFQASKNDGSFLNKI